MNNLNIVSFTMNDGRKQKFVNAYLKKANLTRIQKMQFLGGFKRFELDLYDDQASHPIKSMNDDYQTVKSWIKFNLNN